eukprot:gene29529-35638_t
MIVVNGFLTCLAALLLCYVALKLFVHSISLYKPHLRFNNRDSLPSIWQLLLILLFRIRTKLSDFSNDSSQPLMTICVEDFVVSSQERDIFERLIQLETAHTSKEDARSASKSIPSLSVQYFLPHVLTLRAFLVLCTHPCFPLNLLGALHARSYMHIAKPLALAKAINEGSTCPLSLEVALWGMTRGARGGAEIVFTLDLREKRERGDVVWREVIVLYSRKSPPLIHSQAVKVLQDCEESYPALPNTSSCAAPVHPADSESSVFSISAQDTLAYALMSGDINPIHTVPWGARAFGMRADRIAHGVLAVARALSLQPGTLAQGKLTVGFKAPLPCGQPAEVRKAEAAGGVDIVKAGDSRPCMLVRIA